MNQHILESPMLGNILGTLRYVRYSVIKVS